MTLVRLLARPMLAAIFVVQGAKALKDPDPLVPVAKEFAEQVVPRIRQSLPKNVADRIPEDPRTLVRVTAALQLAAGLGLATGRMPRLSALVLTGSLVPATLAAHAFWDVDDPAQRAAQRIQFMKNLGLGGGLLLAAVDTEGRPGLWWRTRHGAEHARQASARAAREAAHDARRETKWASRTARSRLRELVARVTSG